MVPPSRLPVSLGAPATPATGHWRSTPERWWSIGGAVRERCRAPHGPPGRAEAWLQWFCPWDTTNGMTLRYFLSASNRSSGGRKPRHGGRKRGGPLCESRNSAWHGILLLSLGEHDTSIVIRYRPICRLVRSNAILRPLKPSREPSTLQRPRTRSIHPGRWILQGSLQANATNEGFV